MDDDDDTPPTYEEMWAMANDLTLPAIMRAENWYHLAQHSWFKNEFNECIAMAEMSEICWRDAGYSENEGEAAYWQGRANLRLEQPMKALDCFERAVECYHSVGQERLQADALYGCAECHQAMENTDEALVLFESAARFYLAADNAWMAGDCRIEMGELRGSRGELTEALNDFTQARSLFEKAGHSTMAHRASDRMASAHIEMGQLADAIRILRENIDLAVFLENPSVLGYAQYRLGWTLTINEEHGEALHWLDIARVYFSGPGHSDFYKAEIDMQRLDSLKALGRSSEASQVARGLRAYWRSVGNHARLAVFDANDAFELAVSKEFDEARRMAASAAERAKRECGDWAERVTRLTLAEVEVMSGHPENARNALESDLAEQWGDSVFNRTRHLMVLAAVAKHEGRPNEARGITERVIELVEGTNLVGVTAQAYEMLSTLADAERDHARAQDMRAKAVALFLADGQVARANEIARSLLPEPPEVGRSAEWRVLGADASPPRVESESSPRSQEMPRSRPRRTPSAEQDGPGSNSAQGSTPLAESDSSAQPPSEPQENPGETPDADSATPSETS